MTVDPSGVPRLAWIFVLLVACGSEPGPSGTTVRDSAGIQIVENVIPVASPACPVQSPPTVVIGTVSGDPTQELYRVFDATRFSNGRIGVVNQGSSEFRIYDVDGRYVTAVGRDGDGPGEFRRMFQVLRRADTTVIWDGGLARWSILEPDGVVRRTATIKPKHANEPWLIGWQQDGTMWARYDDFRLPTGPNFVNQFLLVLRYESDGTLRDTVATLPYGTRAVIDPESRMVGGPLFEGRSDVIGTGDRFFLGHGDHAEIAVRDPDWELMRLIRWNPGNLDVTNEHREVYRAERLTAFASASEPIRRGVERRLDIMPAAEQFPAFGDLLTDQVGYLWVQRYPLPGETVQRWMAFAPTGRFTCEVTLARSPRVVEFGEDYLLAIERDDDGVERVMLFGLQRASL